MSFPADRRALVVILLAPAVLALPSLPSLDDAESYIDQAASAVWSKEVGGRAIVGAGAGAVIGLVSQQLSDVINAILMSIAGLVGFRLLTSFRPETFGAQSVQETFGELHSRMVPLLDLDGDGKLDERDARKLLSRVVPFVKRQGPFVVGFALGLAITSSAT